ncbi:hypothetical protein LCL61_17910 [Amycolatopsis coloradensis]|uniref:Uncharacterized protein n=1 Tax=Amycolatopsis coloradensis TaxID=76021 RepID=A0ACD5BDD1_9PSEU
MKRSFRVRGWSRPTTVAAVVRSPAWTPQWRLRENPFVQWQRRCYALYLWHWPVLVYYLVARDGEEVGLRGGAVIIALAFVLAVLTHHLVEKPVRCPGDGHGARGVR